MPSFEYQTPDGSSIKIGITLDELVPFARRFLPSKDNDILYDLPHAATHYGEQPWIEARLPEGLLRVPYTLEHDYRGSSASTWGDAEVSGTFRFPAELEEHRKAAVSRFKRAGRLAKGDTLCPRIVGLEHTAGGLPVYHVQRARYTDQVGTNLSIDWPLKAPVVVNAHECRTVREWDRRQAGLLEPALPSLPSSRLANTVGVSVGVTCRSRDGRMALLQRRRARIVAVYQNMWASPFGFALSLSSDIPDGRHDLKSLIALDMGIEFAEELGLERSAFTEPRPVAFCRDLARGGKPQFFFEMSTSYALEDVVDRLGAKHPEYRSGIRRVEHLDPSDDGVSISPELMCFAALIASHQGQAALGV